MKLPHTIYQIVAQFDRGIGAGADTTADRDAAYNAFADLLDEGTDCRAFEITFDVQSNAFESAREITDDFLSELAGICAERGLTMPDLAAE